MFNFGTLACACQASVVSKSSFAGIRPNDDQIFGLDSSLLLANHHCHHDLHLQVDSVDQSLLRLQLDLLQSSVALRQPVATTTASWCTTKGVERHSSRLNPGDCLA
eukprot:6461188-Amphidinium_carterae.2